MAAGDAAPVTVVADAREAERLGAKAQRWVTIEELFGAPRYGSLPDVVRDAVSREWERVFALHPADPAAAAQERRPGIEQGADAIEADEWQTQAAPIIEPILARAASDPEGLLDDLSSVYPDLKVDALTERLARVLFGADSWGRLTGGSE